MAITADFLVATDTHSGQGLKGGVNSFRSWYDDFGESENPIANQD